MLLEDNLLDEAIDGDEDLLRQFEFNDRLLSFEEAMTSNFENEPSLIEEESNEESGSLLAMEQKT